MALVNKLTAHEFSVVLETMKQYDLSPEGRQIVFDAIEERWKDTTRPWVAHQSPYAVTHAIASIRARDEMMALNETKRQRMAADPMFGAF